MKTWFAVFVCLSVIIIGLIISWADFSKDETPTIPDKMSDNLL